MILSIMVAQVLEKINGSTSGRRIEEEETLLEGTPLLMTSPN